MHCNKEIESFNAREGEFQCQGGKEKLFISKEINVNDISENQH
jgi:hypothetical protein